MASIILKLGLALVEAKRRSYWAFVDAVMSGRRPRTQESIKAPVLDPGAVLQATDRAYVVGGNGAWRNAGKHAENLPASKSQIRLLPKASKNKYNKFTLAQSARPLIATDEAAPAVSSNTIKGI